MKALSFLKPADGWDESERAEGAEMDNKQTGGKIQRTKSEEGNEKDERRRDSKTQMLRCKGIDEWEISKG